MNVPFTFDVPFDASRYRRTLDSTGTAFPAAPNRLRMHLPWPSRCSDSPAKWPRHGCYRSRRPSLFEEGFPGVLELRLFRVAFDVHQDSLVNAVDEQVRPTRPIPLREHVELVPGAAFQTRARTGQGDEQEFSTIAPEKTVQVRRVNVAIGAQFEHRRWLVSHVKGQPARPLPCRDRLDKRARCEFAVTRGSHAPADDSGPLRIGKSQAKIPGGRLRDVRETDDVFPDHVGRRIDLDGRQDFALPRIGHDRFDAGQYGQNQQGCRQLVVGSSSGIGNCLADHSSQPADGNQQRHGHRYTNQALQSEQQQSGSSEQDRDQSEGYR